MHLIAGSELQGGKYRIIRVLGQGGFGITYLAENTFFEKKVAIKEFFPKDFCGRDNTSHLTLGTQNNAETVAKLKERFIKEAKNIAKLDHPGIVKIHDIFEENNTAYYVMDYIEGENLNEMVKRNGPLSEAKAVEYIRKVGDALDYIHSRNMTHFDVKPANIVARRSDDQPILIDFGLSKQYDLHGDATSTLMQGVSQGYSPIELYNAGAITSFSPQTDVYSLGATLYYLITGAVPSPASQVAEDGIKMPTCISPSIKDAITKAMQTSRSKRPSTVSAFYESLKSINTVGSINSSESKISEETQFIASPKKIESNDEDFTATYNTKPVWKRYWGYLITVLCLVVLGLVIFLSKNKREPAPSYSFHGIPRPERLVSDSNGMLTVQQIQSLDSVNYKISQEKNITLVSLIVKDSHTLDFKKEFADSIFNAWGIGDEKTNRGMLVAIDVENKQLCISTGLGLENVYTDDFCKEVINEMVKYCQSNDFYNALLVGSKAFDIKSESSTSSFISSDKEFKDNTVIPSNNNLYTYETTVYETTSATNYPAIMARKHYGRAIYWVYIYDANRDIISDPCNIKDGISLRIPSMESLPGNSEEEREQIAISLATQIKSQFDKPQKNIFILSEIELRNKGENYGTKLMSINATVINPRIKVINNTKSSIPLKIEIFSPKGRETSEIFKDGSSYRDTIPRNYKGWLELKGVGNEKYGNWPKGSYRIEIWSKNRLLIQKNFRVY